MKNNLLKPTWLRGIAVCAMLFCGIQLSAQVVNIESKRMQTDSIRFALRGDVSANYTDNDGQYIWQTGTNITTQLKSKNYKTLYFLLGDYNLIKSAEKDFQNSWFLHFRVNHKLSNLVRLESYIQSQNNKILDVKARNLVGAGIRLKAISTDNVSLYIGEGYMYESETAQVDGSVEQNHRNSAYLSASIHFPNNRVELINTVYYQARYKNWSDYRILEQFKLDIALSNRLNYFTILDYFYDSLTPRDRSQYSFRIKFGVGLKI